LEVGEYWTTGSLKFGRIGALGYQSDGALERPKNGVLETAGSKDSSRFGRRFFWGKENCLMSKIHVEAPGVRGGGGRGEGSEISISGVIQCSSMGSLK